MLCSAPITLKGLRIAWLLYWLPLSELKYWPACGWRKTKATGALSRKERVLTGTSQRGRDVRRVSVDFQKDNLGQRLVEAGYSANLRTLFIWEGVTNYLDAESVDAVFNFFAETASPGSRIIFTYVHAGVLDGRFDAHGLARLTAVLRAYGEPWTFGFKPEELPAYLAKRGIRLLIDLGATEYRRKYMPSANKVVGYEFYRAALAERVSYAAR
jgi:methyltransferase (TIGR00027 family)